MGSRSRIEIAWIAVLCLLGIGTAWAADVAVVQSPAPTSNGGTQDFTSSGFGTPLCAMFFSGYGMTNGTVTDHAGLSVGFSDFTNHFSQSQSSEDGQGTTNTGASRSSSQALRTLLSSTLAVDATATASTITDGARLTWADAPPSAYLVNAVLFGGPNISDCYVGSVAGNATINSTASTSEPGFQPDVILAIAINSSTNLRSSYGFAVNDGGIVQRAAGLADNNGSAAGTQVAATIRADRIVVNPAASSGVPTLELTSFDANGFTVTTRDVGASVTMYYLALKLANGLRAKVLTCASPTVTGNHSCTGAGWTPQAGLMLHTESVAVGTYYSNDDGEVFGISAFTDAASGSSAIAAEDITPTSNTESMTDTKPVHLRKDAGAFMTADFVGFTNDGMTFNYTTAFGTVVQRGVLLFGASENSFVSRRRNQP